MPVPTTIADLTTNEATNYPADSDSVTPTTRPSDYIRAHAAIIKTLEGQVATDIATAVSDHEAAADPHPAYALESALGTASTKNTGTTAGTVPLVGTKSATDALAGLVELATQAEAEAGTDDTVVMTPLKTAQAIPAKLNASGSAPIYACRAWVNFNGTDVVAIRAAGNVSSITDNGTGDYTINFTTALPDANYGFVAKSVKPSDAVTDGGWETTTYQSSTQTASALQVSCVFTPTGSGTAVAKTDSPLVSVAVFR